MLFNSSEYIFFFLPLALLGYFLLQHFKFKMLAKCFLILASWVFYSWWNISFLKLFLFSMIFNYTASRILWYQKTDAGRRFWMALGILGNVCFLGFFKYTDFCLSSINALTGSSLPLMHIVMPLAISFYTFQQIGFLVDVFHGKAGRFHIIDYVLFVSFFPQLISGPIVRCDETMEQFRDPERRNFSSRSCAAGIYQFVIGLGKKVLIADTLAQWVQLGYQSSSTLIMTEAWMTSLAYTLQIYYDFSGYTDMAIGTARMFHIQLPVNFQSPYKAVNIQDFWRRWHMTLSRLLRDIIYIPLGGSRRGMICTAVNTCLTFLLCGLWHGAGWTFIIWGGLHGLALVVWRAFKGMGGRLPAWLGWVLTMLFVNAAWIFFRAPDLQTAMEILKAMADVETLVIPAEWLVLPALCSTEIVFGVLLGVVLLIGWMMVLLFPDSNQMTEEFAPRVENVVFIILIAVISITQLDGVREFIYFNF